MIPTSPASLTPHSSLKRFFLLRPRAPRPQRALGAHSLDGGPDLVRAARSLRRDAAVAVEESDLLNIGYFIGPNLAC